MRSKTSKSKQDEVLVNRTPSSFLFKISPQGNFTFLQGDGSVSPFQADLSPNQRFELAIELLIEVLSLFQSIMADDLEVPKDNLEVIGEEFDGVVSGNVTFKWGHVTQGRQIALEPIGYKTFIQWLLQIFSSLEKSYLQGQKLAPAPTPHLIEEVTHIYQEQEICRDRLDKLLVVFQKTSNEVSELRRRLKNRGDTIHILQMELQTLKKSKVQQKTHLTSKNVKKERTHPKTFEQSKGLSQLSSPVMKTGSETSTSSLVEVINILQGLGVIKTPRVQKVREKKTPQLPDPYLDNK